MDVANKHNRLLKLTEVTLGEILDIANGDDGQEEHHVLRRSVNL